MLFQTCMTFFRTQCLNGCLSIKNKVRGFQCCFEPIWLSLHRQKQLILVNIEVHYSQNVLLFYSIEIVRQVYSSPSILGNIQWLDNSAGHSLNSSYNPTSTVWASSPFTKTPLHPHTSTSIYPNSATPSFTSPKEGFPSPNRDGKESPRLQEVLKAERLSPMGGGGSSFLNLSSAAGGVYGPSPHMLSPYGSYMTTSQDYSSAALYSSAGPWMSPSSYSPKLRNKMRLSPPGKYISSRSDWGR